MKRISKRLKRTPIAWKDYDDTEYNDAISLKQYSKAKALKCGTCDKTYNNKNSLGKASKFDKT